jgi:hypothetical protein
MKNNTKISTTNLFVLKDTHIIKIAKVWPVNRDFDKKCLSAQPLWG